MYCCIGWNYSMKGIFRLFGGFWGLVKLPAMDSPRRKRGLCVFSTSVGSRCSARSVEPPTPHSQGQAPFTKRFQQVKEADFAQHLEIQERCFPICVRQHKQHFLPVLGAFSASPAQGSQKKPLFQLLCAHPGLIPKPQWGAPCSAISAIICFPPLTNPDMHKVIAERLRVYQQHM